MSTPVLLALFSAAALVILRGLYVLRVVSWSLSNTMRLYRAPDMPSFGTMVLRFWVWDRLALTNDVEWLQHRRQATGPFAKPDAAAGDQRTGLKTNG